MPGNDIIFNLQAMDAETFLETFTEKVANRILEKLDERNKYSKESRMSQNEVMKVYGRRWLERAKSYGLKGAKQGGRIIYYAKADVEKFAAEFPDIVSFVDNKIIDASREYSSRTAPQVSLKPQKKFKKRTQEPC